MTPLEVIQDDLGAVTLETKLLEIDCDSLEFMEMIVDLEKKFKVKLADELIAKIVTVGELCDAVNAQVN